MVVVAWGVEFDYLGPGGRWHKGRDIMAGTLKRRWPHATHFTLDVRGFLQNDPGRAGGHVNLEEEAKNPDYAACLRFLISTVVAFGICGGSEELVLSLCCSKGRRRSRLLGHALVFAADCQLYLPSIDGIESLQGEPTQDDTVARWSLERQVWIQQIAMNCLPGALKVKEEQEQKLPDAGQKAAAAKPDEHRRQGDDRQMPDADEKVPEALQKLREIVPAVAILLEKLQIDEGACVQLLGLAQYNERGLYYAKNLQVALGNIHSGSKRHANPSALVTAHCREKTQEIMHGDVDYRDPKRSKSSTGWEDWNAWDEWQDWSGWG